MTHATYAYDTASRLWTVTDDLTPGTPYSAQYTYLDNSALAGTVTFKQGTTPGMTTTKAYDKLNRLAAITNTPTGTGERAVSYAYLYNDANQRVRATLADGSFWMYEYDKLGQVKSGKKYWSDWTPVAGQQFEYGHDDIGNRTQTRSGGDENGANLRTNDYTRNLLNQYTSRTVPRKVDVMGVAFANQGVSVTSYPFAENNGASAYRRGEYFRKELAYTSTAALWENVAVDTTEPQTPDVLGAVFVPGHPESFTPDADGNLVTDGRWSYTWDAENRLVRLVAATGVGPQQRIDFEYDTQSRRIGKKVWNNTGGTGDPAVDQRFLYDGWNLLAIVNAQSSLLASFTWGSDLSGSLQGAGGVGGLLITRDTALGTVNCAGYDGNGNVMALVNAADGKVNAQYEYGPFGEPIRATGTMAKANPFRFSTKFQDNETDLLYYGYRFYNQATGRWLSRDPIGERGGENVYGFAKNDSMSFYDLLGKVWFRWEDGTSFNVTPSVSGTGLLCRGRPLGGLILRVDFYVMCDDAGVGGLWQEGAHFEYNVDSAGPGPTTGISAPPQDFVGTPSMSWHNDVLIDLPNCPRGRQTGAASFAVHTRYHANVLTIAFKWWYSCDCSCAEDKPLDASFEIGFKRPPIIPGRGL